MIECVLYTFLLLGLIVVVTIVLFYLIFKGSKGRKGITGTPGLQGEVSIFFATMLFGLFIKDLFIVVDISKCMVFI